MMLLSRAACLPLFSRRLCSSPRRYADFLHTLLRLRHLYAITLDAAMLIAFADDGRAVCHADVTLRRRSLSAAV